jgi:hypothetical protein
MRNRVHFCVVTNIWQERASPVLNAEDADLKMEAWRHITEESSLCGRHVRISYIKEVRM